MYLGVAMKKAKQKILLVDESEEAASELKKALSDEGYQVFVLTNGDAVLDCIEKKKIELVFLPLILPNIHGIHILRELREQKKRDIGVVICTAKALPQNHESAIECGADFFLVKPFAVDYAVMLVKRFFRGELEPEAYSDQPLQNFGVEKFIPTRKEYKSYIRFWGTRGSIPVSGLDYYRYGGNTACLEVRDAQHAIIIDAGTGIRPLSKELLKSDIKNIHLFIGHTHWDHIIGFPFFTPVYIPGYTVDIYAATGFGKSIEEIFTGMLDHDYFPVRLDEMQAQFQFHELRGTEPVRVGEIEIHYHYAIHPGATLCFKIKSPNRTIGYATDNEMLIGYHGHPNDIGPDHPLLKPYQSLIDFFSDCDVLIHEAQYTPSDYLKKVGWGHSSISNAMVLVRHAGIKEWIVTHHDPEYTDTDLGKKLSLHHEIMRDCDLDCRVYMAFDGQILPL